MKNPKDSLEFLSGKIEALEILMGIVHWESIIIKMNPDEFDELMRIFNKEYLDTPLMSEREKGFNMVFRTLGHHIRDKQEINKSSDAVSV